MIYILCDVWEYIYNFMILLGGYSPYDYKYKYHQMAINSC